MVAPTDDAADVSILLIGDCTLATGYLPPRLRNERVLQARLAEMYPAERVAVVNEGLDSETVLGFLRRYERTMRRYRPDYVFVRYGVNDRRAYGVQGFREQLALLMERLRSDLPETRMLLETGMYVDYPAHYAWDRNRVLEPIYQVMRELAAEQGIPLVEIYRRMEQETAAGNWDLRVRGYGVVDEEMPVIGPGQDHIYGSDVRWFTNIHPNPAGIRLIVDEEATTLRRYWPMTLRTVGK
ncbi:MAG: hypothetical protein NVS4B8_02350 [Herpetosiphon sp.]